MSTLIPKFECVRRAGLFARWYRMKWQVMVYVDGAFKVLAYVPHEEAGLMICDAFATVRALNVAQAAKAKESVPSIVRVN